MAIILSPTRDFVQRSGASIRFTEAERRDRSAGFVPRRFTEEGGSLLVRVKAASAAYDATYTLKPASGSEDTIIAGVVPHSQRLIDSAFVRYRAAPVGSTCRLELKPDGSSGSPSDWILTDVKEITEVADCEGNPLTAPGSGPGFFPPTPPGDPIPPGFGNTLGGSVSASSSGGGGGGSALDAELMFWMSHLH